MIALVVIVALSIGFIFGCAFASLPRRVEFVREPEAQLVPLVPAHTRKRHRDIWN